MMVQESKCQFADSNQPGGVYMLVGGSFHVVGSFFL